MRKLSSILNIQSIDLESIILCKYFFFFIPLNTDILVIIISLVVSEDEAIVLHAILSPSELGTITVYLPVVLDLSKLE